MRSRWMAYLLLAVACATNLAAWAETPPKDADKNASDVVNEKLPRWLRFSAEYRIRLEGFTGGGFKHDNDDAYVLSRLRLTMKAQPTSWLKFMVQGQDAHVFGKNQHPAAPPFQDTMDLRQAFVEIGDAEKKPIYLRAGRQELAFGEERLVGNADWLNTARSFDALRGGWRHDGYSVDLFAASVVKPHDGQFNESTPGNYFYGVYGGLAKLVPQAKVEPYFFWRRSPFQLTETGTRGTLGFATVGLRWVGKLPAGFDYGMEMAKQAGSLGTDGISAWAAHWVAGHTWGKARTKPRLWAEYNFASGDGNSKDGKRGTFDSLYATGHDKFGLDDQVGWRNMENTRAGIELKPATKWMLSGRYDAWWLANPHDALYDAGGNSVVRVANGTAGRYVGQELDVVTLYNVTKQMKLGAGYGHLFPGAFLKKATAGASYNLPYVSCSVSF